MDQGGETLVKPGEFMQTYVIFYYFRHIFWPAPGESHQNIQILMLSSGEIRRSPG